MTEKEVTSRTALDLGLDEEEFDRTKEIIGRVLTLMELTIFAAIWSETCSSKNSMTWLKTLPRDGENMLPGPGRTNTGLVDIGGGLACVLEMEAHRYPFPQASPPPIGKAFRNIHGFSVRPLASLHTLYWGHTKPPQAGHLLRGIIRVIGTPTNDIASSEYLRLVQGIKFSPAPRFDLDEECHIQQNIKALNKHNILQSTHDISEGGLFVSLLESALVNNLGFNIETDGNFRKDAYLFGEGQSQIIISVTGENEDQLVNFLNGHNVSFSKLGEVAGNHMVTDHEDFGPLSEWRDAHDSFLTAIADT